MSQGFTRSQKKQKIRNFQLATERLVEQLNDKFINKTALSEKIWDELSEIGVIIDESIDITTTKLNQVKIA
ncbi:10942_t:CDS:2 [Entrophospora sp. SA101]|nr:10942_t:CDS:2 [Entrophospora sp. SA101]